MKKRGNYIFFPEIENRAKAEEAITSVVSQLMKKVGMPEVFIYAFQKTGLLITIESRSEYHKEDQEKWDAAIVEYERDYRSQDKSDP